MRWAAPGSAKRWRLLIAAVAITGSACAQQKGPPRSSATPIPGAVDLGVLASDLGETVRRQPLLGGLPIRPEPQTSDAFTFGADAADALRVDVRRYEQVDRSFWERHDIPTAFRRSINWNDAAAEDLVRKEAEWAVPIPDLDPRVDRARASCVAGWNAKGLTDCFSVTYWIEVCRTNLEISVSFPGSDDGTRYRERTDRLVQAVIQQASC
jgi:hypothetical protein